MEKPHRGPELAVVALLGFFHAVEIRLQILLVGPAGAVDARELRIARIAAPVGAGKLRQLERTHLARVLHVRPAAQVGEIAERIERHARHARCTRLDEVGVFQTLGGRRAARGQQAEQFDLVGLARLFHERDGIGDRHFGAHERQLALADLAHLGFDLRQVLGRQRHGRLDVVVEARVGRRAHAQLRVGEELQYGGREHVRARMPHAVEVGSRFRVHNRRSVRSGAKSRQGDAENTANPMPKQRKAMAAWPVLTRGRRELYI